MDHRTLVDLSFLRRGSPDFHRLPDNWVVRLIGGRPTGMLVGVDHLLGDSRKWAREGGHFAALLFYRRNFGGPQMECGRAGSHPLQIRRIG
jgi:hypothetical protein